ncbi:MAG: caspase family protein [Spirochaetia bacterium]|jgi:hypothetical protein|nr:caspase family protein [Spirochaetia bacterium]
MKKLVLFAALGCAVLAAACAPSSSEDRGVRVAARTAAEAAEEAPAEASPAGRQYALLIAIDRYRAWPALKKPVADARDIRDILKERYYIDEVIELYNAEATKGNIIKTFTELQKKLDTQDSLFIYYAGHGHLDAASNAGFWVPVDAGTDVYGQENWLPNSQIRGYISQLKSIHVFLASDACFSGDILNTTRALPGQIDNEYYRRAYALQSRQVLTSGSSETVPDESEFSRAFKVCLRKNEAPLLDPVGIYNDVRLSVSATTPLYGTLNQANHQEGATFLFFRRTEGAVRSAPAPAGEAAAVPGLAAEIETGAISVYSDVAGSVLIDGAETGTRVKAQGTVLVRNVPTGATEIAVRGEDGRITRAASRPVVRAGRTVSAEVRNPAAAKPAVPSAPAAREYAPGDVGPGGGIVFYDKGSSSGGWRYLEAAAQDAGEAEWGLYDKNTDAAGTAVGDGKTNTRLILEALRREGETGRAAQLCAAFEAGGFTDWFLPSKDELVLMYRNLKLKGLGNFGDRLYWSSSSLDAESVAGRNFGDGKLAAFYKDSPGRVRAVRAF